MFTNLRNTLADAFQSTAVRVAVALVALGAVPVYMLSMVTAALR